MRWPGGPHHPTVIEAFKPACLGTMQKMGHVTVCQRTRPRSRWSTALKMCKLYSIISWRSGKSDCGTRANTGPPPLVVRTTRVTE